MIFSNLPLEFGAATTELSIIRVIGGLLSKMYLLWFFKSSYFIDNGVKSFTGTAGQQRIHKDYLATCLFPLSPLAEQKRIVAKIEELLPYMDRYEQAWNCLEAFNSRRFPDEMKKSIFQLVIQGKLVEQRPEEGTAEELYREISQYHQELKLCKDELNFSAMDYELPNSWKMVN